MKLPDHFSLEPDNAVDKRVHGGVTTELYIFTWIKFSTVLTDNHRAFAYFLGAKNLHAQAL
jgi:MOSC domain-containing protein YiiM